MDVLETLNVHDDVTNQPSARGGAIRISHLVKTYAQAQRGEDLPRAVDDFSIEIKDGEFFTLLGPSGCGKTTTLRSLAGLETPDSGDIELSGQVVYSSAKKINVPTDQRRVGMVFQSYAIWPHMTVFENVAFPLRVQKRRNRLSAGAIKDAVERALAVVELDAYAGRGATKLSGGQQQRLALARAMVARPAVMLLDEPLSNLDAKLRDSMRIELKRLQNRSGFTAVYVTHDQVEALAMSSRIAIMNGGVVQQIGAPKEIYAHPANRFVAGFIGRMNFLDGTVVSSRSSENELLEVNAGLGVANRARSAENYTRGESVTLCVRPEGVRIHPPREDGAGNGRIRAAQFLGEAIEYIVTVNDRELLVRADPQTLFERGATVSVELIPTATWLLRR
jgi:iron(III) transport system ATP-binding protein